MRATPIAGAACWAAGASRRKRPGDRHLMACADSPTEPTPRLNHIIRASRLQWPPGHDLSWMPDRLCLHVAGQRSLADHRYAGPDIIVGTPTGDDIRALGGDDTVCGVDGDDNMHAGSGNDYMHGGNGDDILEGSFGNDRLRGSFGNDFVAGNSGDDEIFGGQHNDFMSGGPGNDLVGGGQGTDAARIRRAQPSKAARPSRDRLKAEFLRRPPARRPFDVQSTSAPQPLGVDRAMHRMQSSVGFRQKTPPEVRMANPPSPPISCAVRSTSSSCRR